MRLKGKQPKLTARQQTEITRMHATGECTISDLIEAFSDARGQSPQQPGDRQQDSDRGEVEEKTVRGQRRYGCI